MKTLGSRELCTEVIGKNRCTGCGACMALCPYFLSYKGKTTMAFPCTLPEGKCFTYCPRIEVDLDILSLNIFGKPYSSEPLGYYRQIRTAKAGKAFSGENFQTGGTVSALVHFALKKGYLNGAVLTDRNGLQPLPRFITDPDEVFRCATSKFTPVPTLAVLNRQRQHGTANIGIVGTPCQVTATALMRHHDRQGRPKEISLGLVIGLFCTWGLDYRRFERFLSEKVNLQAISKIDIPPPPAEVMKIQRDRKTRLEIPLGEIRPLVPESCGYCIDMTSEFADISVGVLEGQADMNTLIIRTERGLKLVEEAHEEGCLLLADMPGENLEHLKQAAGGKKRRAFLKAAREGIVNSSGSECSYLRLNSAVFEKIIA